MNVKLLEKIKKHILEEPRRFVMWNWIMKKGKGVDEYSADGPGEYRKFAKCGTAACIAGWACILGGERETSDVEISAMRLLDVENARLFHVDWWPSQFRTQYYSAKTPAKRSRIAAKRIDHYAATKGQE